MHLCKPITWLSLVAYVLLGLGGSALTVCCLEAGAPVLPTWHPPVAGTSCLSSQPVPEARFLCGNDNACRPCHHPQENPARRDSHTTGPTTAKNQIEPWSLEVSRPLVAFLHTMTAKTGFAPTCSPPPSPALAALRTVVLLN